MTERAQAVANSGKCGDCNWVPSQSHSPPTIEPGDPQRCGSTAWVTVSSLPAGANLPSQSRFARQLPHRGSQGRLRRRISFANVWYCIVGAKRRRCLPMGETTGRLIAVILWCDRPRRSLDFDSLRVAPPLRRLCHRITRPEISMRCRGGACNVGGRGRKYFPPAQNIS